MVRLGGAYRGWAGGHFAPAPPHAARHAPYTQTRRGRTTCFFKREMAVVHLHETTSNIEAGLASFGEMEVIEEEPAARELIFFSTWATILKG